LDLGEQRLKNITAKASLGANLSAFVVGLLGSLQKYSQKTGKPMGRCKKTPWLGKAEDWHGKASGSADFKLITLFVIRRRAHEARRLRLQEGLEGQVMLVPNIEGRGALLRRSVEALKSHL
jgi:hypothetical protein